MEPPEVQPWRLAEIAWVAHLQASGHAVMHFGAAVGNDTRSSAPLLSLPDRKVRAPDVMTMTGGSSEYWEVKYRTRRSVDPLTGANEHWMAHAALADYVAIAHELQIRVWVVLHEARTSTGPAKWLKGDVLDMVAAGHEDIRFGRDGEEILAWVWPVAAMEVVPGPPVELPPEGAPVLVDEGGGAALALDELEPVERRIRRIGASHRPTGESGPVDDMPTRGERALVADALTGLDVHRRSLGVPQLPRYSVLRVGGQGVDLDGTLELLHYGIRVFLVTGRDREGGVAGRGLQAFAAASLLSWAEIDEEPPNGIWVVDGDDELLSSEAVRQALDSADETGTFNAGQYLVVHAPVDADVLVTAGAGTGKTEVMAERLIRLLSTQAESPGDPRPGGVDLGEVALITFTRDAAREIRERLARTLVLRQRLCSRNVQPIAWLLGISSIEVSTIHAFAQGILRREGGPLGLSPSFRVARHTMAFRRLLHQALSRRVGELYDRHGDTIAPAHEWQSHVEQIWEALANNGVDVLDRSVPGVSGLSDVNWSSDGLGPRDAEVATVVTDTLLELAASFSVLCERTETIPTSSLVPLAIAALHAGGEQNLRHVFVDEFQDTDPVQMEILLSLRKRSDTRLFAVGDQKQGIYRFRGAEGDAFNELVDRFRARGLPEPVELGLRWNYRTHRMLLDSLDPVFSSLGSRGVLSYGQQERLLAAIGDENGIAPKTLDLTPITRPEKRRFDALATRIVHEWRTRFPDASIAVLCRENWQALQVQRAIRRTGGACDLVVGGDFYLTPAVRELRALLEAVVDPQDGAAVLEVLETRWAAGLTGTQPLLPVPEAQKKLWLRVLDPVLPFADRVALLDEEDHRLTEDLGQLRERLASLGDLAGQLPVLEWLVECIEQLRPHRCAIPEDSERERDRYARCLDHLVTLLDQRAGADSLSLERLLSHLRLQIATRAPEDEPVDIAGMEGRTTALTVHKAKGLEFDLVLVPHTWTQFGPKNSTKTRAVVVDRRGAPRLAWAWTWGGAATNVSGSDAHLWADDDVETVKEEARLMYVALTRARWQTKVLVPERGGISASEPRTWANLLDAVR